MELHFDKARLDKKRFGLSWVVIILGAIFLLLFAVFVVPRITATYLLFWSKGSIERLFYEDLGFSESASSFLAVVLAFVYALAWIPLSMWSYRLFWWRFNTKQLTIAFASWVFVYGHVPLLKEMFSKPNVCFNQSTGAPLKWYVETADGDILLFDSAGFDSGSGKAKLPVTPEICSRFTKQIKNARPQRITTEVHNIEYFDPMTARPRVFYSRSDDGIYSLYDARGFDPVTGVPLKPVDKNTVADIIAHAPVRTIEVPKAFTAPAPLIIQPSPDDLARRQREQEEGQRQDAARRRAEEQQRRDLQQKRLEELQYQEQLKEAQRQAELRRQQYLLQLQRQRAQNPQYQGGVIPCSADDKSWNGHQWVSNCNR